MTSPNFSELIFVENFLNDLDEQEQNNYSYHYDNYFNMFINNLTMDEIIFILNMYYSQEEINEYCLWYKQDYKLIALIALHTKLFRIIQNIIDDNNYSDADTDIHSNIE